MRRVLTIIVSYNGQAWIEKCLESVVSSKLKSDIFLIDNGSSDDTPRLVDAFVSSCPDAIVERLSRDDNPGFGAANNIGLRYAMEKGYDYAYLLNQDAYLAADTLHKLVEVADADASYAILSPGQLQNDWHTPDANFAKFNPDRPDRELVAWTRFAPAAHWLVRVSSLHTLGLFSPTFRHYGEDDNLIDRARYWKLGVGVVPSAKAVHDRAARKLTKTQRCTAKCRIPYVRLSDPNCNIVFRLLWEPVWLVGCSIKNRSFIPLSSLPALLRALPMILRNRRLSKLKGAFSAKS